jgi:hypothetical protein
MKSKMQSPFVVAHVIESRIKKAKKGWFAKGAIPGARALSFSLAGTSARASLATSCPVCKSVKEASMEVFWV